MGRHLPTKSYHIAALYIARLTSRGDHVGLWPMLLKKGKNEPIKIFACAPVETGFS
jgi:hypothetical protein